MEYFVDFEKCEEEEMSEDGSAVDQMWKLQIQKKLAAAQRRKFEWHWLINQWLNIAKDNWETILRSLSQPFDL